MKKVLYVLAAVLAVSACSKEAAQNDSISKDGIVGNGTNGTVVSFSVKIDDVSDVKATISSNTNFTWETTDRAAVFTDEGSKVILSPSDISGGEATFTGAVPSGEKVSTGAIVVYPAAFYTSAGNITFPDEYGASTETKGQGTVLAAKVTGDRKLSFKYLAATMKATITDVPSVATSITVTSSAVLTGSHSIDFSGSTPSMSTSSTAKTVTFTSPSTGNNVLIVPVPTTGSEQTFTYAVKISDSDLFTRSTTKTLARNTYMSMAELTITPTVYLMSTMTTSSWDVSDKVEMALTETTASITLNATTSCVWRTIVVYPAGYWVYYGFSDSDKSSTSGTFNNITSAANKYSASVHSGTVGNYTLSFDYTTGAYSSSHNSSAVINFSTGNSSRGALETMTKLTSTTAWGVRKWANNIYAYYNTGYTASRANWDLGSGDKYYLFLYNFSSNSLTPQYFTATDKAWTDVWITYTTDSWSTNSGEIAMTNISGTPIWYINVDWANSAEFCFKGKGSDWESDQNRGEVLSISGYTATVSNAGGDRNYSIGKGKYTIFFCEDGRKLVVLNRSL